MIHRSGLSCISIIPTTVAKLRPRPHAFRDSSLLRIHIRPAIVVLSSVSPIQQLSPYHMQSP